MWLTAGMSRPRSEEHTSELQSLRQLVCRLLLEKKNRRPGAGRPAVAPARGRTDWKPRRAHGRGAPTAPSGHAPGARADVDHRDPQCRAAAIVRPGASTRIGPFAARDLRPVDLTGTDLVGLQRHLGRTALTNLNFAGGACVSR